MELLHIGNGVFENCFSIGDVTGGRYVCGITGSGMVESTANCLVVGKITTTRGERTFASGLVGVTGSDYEMNNCAFIGQIITTGVNLEKYIFSMGMPKTISNNYYNVQGEYNYIIGEETEDVLGKYESKSKEEIKQFMKTTLLESEKWKENPNGEYPILSWQ